MKDYLRQYPDIYSDSNATYLYFSDDGTRFYLVAGQDGVTEEWISILKQAHRETYNALRRAARIRWDGEKYARKVVSLDEKGSDYAENVLGLIDPTLYGEERAIQQEKSAEFNMRFSVAWASLTDKQKELLVAVRVKHIPQKEIARREGVDCTSIRDRLRIIEKKIGKQLPKDFFRK